MQSSASWPYPYKRLSCLNLVSLCDVVVCYDTSDHNNVMSAYNHETIAQSFED